MDKINNGRQAMGDVADLGSPPTAQKCFQEPKAGESQI